MDDKTRAVHKAWEQSKAGKVSQKLRNQRRRDKGIPMTDKQLEAHTRYAEAYRGSAHGKAVRKTWEQSDKGKLSMKLRNQRRRDKQQAVKAADEQQTRDSEIRLDGKLIGHIIDGVRTPLPI